MAFSSESLPRTWIAGWIPVRASNTGEQTRLTIKPALVPETDRQAIRARD